MRLSLLVVALFASVLGSPQRPVRKDQRIGFTLDNQFRNEENDGTGGVVGEYGVRTGDGCLRVTRYKATANGGFKILSVRKDDCNPARQVSRLRPDLHPPRSVSRPKKLNAPRPQRPVAIQERPVPAPAPAPIQTKPVTTVTDRPTPVETFSRRPAPAAKPVGVPLPPVVRPTEPKKPKLKKPTRNPNKKTRGRPKQLKKDFDFNALKSNDNPARPLDKKEDPVYSFGFTAPGHGHTQSGLDDGSKKGEYFFDSPDGWRRIVTYVANEKGFFPKMRRIRIPGWTSTTPAPRVPFNRSKRPGGGSEDAGGPGSDNQGKENQRNGGSDADRRGGVGGSGGVGGVGQDGQSGGKNGGTGGRGSSGPGGEDDTAGKQLLQNLPRAGVGSCPYYFFYNTKVNFHWERCMENGTKVGQYGKLHEDGFSYRTSYYADTTGYHPTSTKIPLTPEQRSIVHDFTEGVFILPKTDEERQETEARILKWLEQNRDLLRDPLQA